MPSDIEPASAAQTLCRRFNCTSPRPIFEAGLHINQLLTCKIILIQIKLNNIWAGCDITLKLLVSGQRFSPRWLSYRRWFEPGGWVVRNFRERCLHCSVQGRTLVPLWISADIDAFDAGQWADRAADSYRSWYEDTTCDKTPE